MAKKNLPFLLAFLLLGVKPAFSQQGLIVGQNKESKPITTAVPFLLIAPDARSGAMGDVGVAIDPDANSIHWNPAKMAFLRSKFGFSVNHTPWLGKIVNDMSISYLSGYYKLSKTQALYGSLRYFDLGNIHMTGLIGEFIGDFNPREVAADLGYSMQLAEGFGIGITGRFIHSNLTGHLTNSGQDAKAGVSAAVDIGAFYKTELNTINESTLSFGANISNFGARLTYLSPEEADFIPTNLKLGTAYTTQLDQYNKLTFALDFNKLLVPTPEGKFYDQNGKPDGTFLGGVFGSFFDAPGGFREEIREITTGLAMEYWYNDLFALRSGYFHEHATKGARQFFTMGIGLRYQVFGFDFAYLVPVKQKHQQEHPLAETLRFSLMFNFAGGGDN